MMTTPRGHTFVSSADLGELAVVIEPFAVEPSHKTLMDGLERVGSNGHGSILSTRNCVNHHHQRLDTISQPFYPRSLSADTWLDHPQSSEIHKDVSGWANQSSAESPPIVQRLDQLTRHYMSYGFKLSDSLQLQIFWSLLVGPSNLGLYQFLELNYPVGPLPY